jgi:predicted DNA-binding protein
MGAVVSMKTGTVTIRLPEEKIEQFKHMAKIKGMTLAEFVREQALVQIESKADGSGEVLKRIEDLETKLAGAQKVVADLLVVILRNIVGTRYHASLATTYADDIITVMQTGNVLSQGEVEQRQVLRETEALRIETETVAHVLAAKDKGVVK